MLGDSLRELPSLRSEGHYGVGKEDDYWTTSGEMKQELLH